MKRNRILFLIAWIASVVGISFFGGPVSYGFFALLTLLPLISLLYLYVLPHLSGIGRKASCRKSHGTFLFHLNE